MSAKLLLPWAEVVQAYHAGESSCALAEKHKTTHGTIRAGLRRLGVQIRNRFECHRRYSINQSFFSVLNASSAYYLGLLYADGYMDDKHKTVSINLSGEDKELLVKFAKQLETDRPLLSIKPSKKVRYRLDRPELPMKQQPSTRLVIDCRPIYDDLFRHGLRPRKSLTLAFPAIPQKLLPHFIRGYFDGDGCVSYSRVKSRKNAVQAYVSITSTKEFLTCIKEYCAPLLELSFYWRKRFKDDKNTYELCISGNRQVLAFLNWLYRRGGDKLERKYEKFRYLQKAVKTKELASSHRHLQSSQTK